MEVSLNLLLFYGMIGCGALCLIGLLAQSFHIFAIGAAGVALALTAEWFLEGCPMRKEARP